MTIKKLLRIRSGQKQILGKMLSLLTWIQGYDLNLLVSVTGVWALFLLDERGSAKMAQNLVQINAIGNWLEPDTWVRDMTGIVSWKFSECNLYGWDLVVVPCKDEWLSSAAIRGSISLQMWWTVEPWGNNEKYCRHDHNLAPNIGRHPATTPYFETFDNGIKRYLSVFPTPKSIVKSDAKYGDILCTSRVGRPVEEEKNSNCDQVQHSSQ